MNNSTNTPFIPSDTPFNADQKQWLDGFFAGMNSRLLAVGAEANTASALKPLTIIVGTQTGNAEAMAELAAEQAKNEGMGATVLDMDDADLDQLASTERLLVITSTYGEGEMPDNAQALWEAIEEDGAPSFENTFYSVLALGDTSYDDFCLAGKQWDDRLAELGATRIADRVDCDVDFEDPSQEWIDRVLPEISQRGSQEVAEAAAAAPAATEKKAKSKFNRKNPLKSVLTTKRVLTGEESSKEICHFEFNLGDSGEVYDAGDALNIISPNRPDLVDELLELLGSDGSETPAGLDKTLREALTNDLEIRTPSKELIAEVAKRSGDDELNRLLENADKEALEDYLWGKDVVDMIKLHEGASFTVDEFLAVTKGLAPRAYSISSSIKKHENEVHLTIGSVRYHTNERDHNGVASTFLADIANEGDTVLCYFSPNKNFSVPADPELPMIMVGPGTGIAPFRAFLEEREATGANGDNWLFFGDRNSKSDFIYQDELEAMQESGILTKLDLAFSRDQAEKIYVQDRMREQGETLFAWLERGGYFFICGDAFRMAKDVDKALHEVIETHGKMSAEDAVAYVNKLKKEKRYVRDVY